MDIPAVPARSRVMLASSAAAGAVHGARCSVLAAIVVVRRGTREEVGNKTEHQPRGSALMNEIVMRCEMSCSSFRHTTVRHSGDLFGSAAQPCAEPTPQAPSPGPSPTREIEMLQYEQSIPPLDQPTLRHRCIAVPNTQRFQRQARDIIPSLTMAYPSKTIAVSQISWHVSPIQNLTAWIMSRTSHSPNHRFLNQLSG